MSVRAAMMKQITTTTAQVGTVQTPQGKLFSTNCQSIKEGATRDSASEVQGQKLSSEAREDEEEENDRHRGGGVIHHLAPPPGMNLENWYYCVEL